MHTCKQTETGGPSEFQHGVAASLSRYSRGADKPKDAGKPPKTNGKDPLRDMLYYTQKLSGLMGQRGEEDMDATPAILHAALTGEQLSQAPSDTQESALTEIEVEEGGEEAAQLTLADILRAVHNCTASAYFAGEIWQHEGGTGLYPP